MIPKNIHQEHILKAIEEGKKTGIPKRRGSKKFLVEFNGVYYPPKYIISLANKYANGEELNPSEFSGGRESNDFLRALGFQIVEIKMPKKIMQIPPEERKKTSSSVIHHDESCLKCKDIIKKLLEKIYGKVEQNYKVKVGTRPEDFLNISCYGKLKEIYKVLQNHRGFEELVKAKTLPNCDFFVPNPGFVIEFDESQHFTLPRKITLEMYPNELELGFNGERWIALCEKINARDRDRRTPHRDEQRAWYDTLRDFLPAIKGLKPTVRLFAGDYVWCSLNPDDTSDIEKFTKFLRKASESWDIEVRDEPNPFLSRIVIGGEWDGDPNKAKALLEDVCAKWPKDKKVKFLVTCGGFVQFDWPKSISLSDIGDNRYPRTRTVDILVEEAKKCAKSVLSNDLANRLRECTDYVTLGVDSKEHRENLKKPHIELVLVFDLRHDPPRCTFWTGKSYPLSKQQNGLVRISDLQTHFAVFDGEKVMILGCHDLKMFDPRHYKRNGMNDWRKSIIKDFHTLAQEEKPTLVLQHPHTTDCVEGIQIAGKKAGKRSPGIWDRAWEHLMKIIPTTSIRYASAGKYWNNSEPTRSKLEDVLKKTKNTDTIDFIVQQCAL